MKGSDFGNKALILAHNRYIPVMLVKLCFYEKKRFEIASYTCAVIQHELKTYFVAEPVLSFRPFTFCLFHSSRT